MIEVLIVEDSRVVSEYLYYILSKDPEIQVIGNVSNGKKAIEFVKEHKPDVITMDVDMPIMDGLEATGIIMSTTPVPIIMVTASRNAKESRIAMEALAAGALSVIEKPAGIGHPDEEKQQKELLKMVKLISEIKVITRRPHLYKKPDSITQFKKAEVSFDDFYRKKIVAVGISSGGPVVLQKIFSKITKQFPLPILVVQHITSGFLDGLVNWLNDTLRIPIHAAVDNETVLPGHIYFAPDGHEMAVDKTGKIILTRCRLNNGICPSVAHLFNSIANEYVNNSITMILTGMGSDGAKELKLLRDAGSITIAQDKESSMVHGMPGVAINLDAADYILNPEEIAEILYKIEINK
ncbi:MAG: chemotaxis-specific protein-glutamate methyltransferase CheB [bacterium]